MTPKTLYVVLHAACRPERAAGLARVLAHLPPEHTIVHEDHVGKGSLLPWLDSMRAGIAHPGDYTHITTLPDDAILPTGFASAFERALTEKPEAILCTFSNHRRTQEAFDAGASFLECPDGYVGFAGTMPIVWWQAHLDWRDQAITDGELVQNDEGVNLWAMATGRPITKVLPSLCRHDCALPSLDGHDEQNTEGLVVRDSSVAWKEDVTQEHFDGKTVSYGRANPKVFGSHWHLITQLRPEHRAIEQAYDVARGGKPVSSTPSVLITTPAYGATLTLPYQIAVNREVEDLRSHGIGVATLQTPGDSLISRGRNRLVHQFLKSDATHMLWWDSDIAPKRPGYVREMLATGHDIVAGAYPFKNGTGHVVCNLWPEDYTGNLEVRGGCLNVRDAGTGFMLVSRASVLAMMRQYPDRMYLSSAGENRGEPEWTLYNGEVVDREYLSEDYLMCHLWQDMGGIVCVYIEAEFRHWGMHGFEGSLKKQYGLEVVSKAAAE